MAEPFLPTDTAYLPTDATHASIRSTAGSTVANTAVNSCILHDTSAAGSGSRGAGTDFQSSVTADSSMVLDSDFDRGNSNWRSSGDKWFYDQQNSINPKRISSTTNSNVASTNGNYSPPSSKSKRALSYGASTITASPARIMRSTEKSSPTGGRAVPVSIHSPLFYSSTDGIKPTASLINQVHPNLQHPEINNNNHHPLLINQSQSQVPFGMDTSSHDFSSGQINPRPYSVPVAKQARTTNTSQRENSPSSFVGLSEGTPPPVSLGVLPGVALINSSNSNNNDSKTSMQVHNQPQSSMKFSSGGTPGGPGSRNYPYNIQKQSFKSISELSATLGGPQPLTASNYAKQVKLDGSNIWNHVKDYRPASLESIQTMIQKCYYEIGKAEDDTKVLFDSISQAQKNNSDFNETDFNPDYLNKQYEQLYRAQVALVSAYVKFIRISYHPSGNASVKGLIWKYKIYQRMWSRGIFQFLELIRFRLPHSGVLINKFIGHCFVLLGLVADVGNDAANTWHEALGDLARFGFYASTRWNPSLAVASWDELSKYWYLRAATADLSNGRVLHHLALVTTDMERVYYFCKGLISSNPSSINTRSLLSATVDYIFPSRGRGMFYVFRSYLKLVLLGQYNSLESPRTALVSRLDENIRNIVSQGLEIAPVVVATNRMSELALELGPLVIEKYGAMLAYCNIAAFLAMGSYQKNDIIRVFLQKNNTASSNKGFDMVSAEQSEFVGKQLSTTFEVMSAFLKMYAYQPRDVGLPHMIVWFEFCYAMYDESLNFAELFGYLPSSPLVQLADYLNAILASVKKHVGFRVTTAVPADKLLRAIEKWIHSPPNNQRQLSSFDLLEKLNAETFGVETRGHFPCLRERPLPEDWVVWGSVWCKVLAHPDLSRDKERRAANIIKEYESYVNDDAYPGEIGSQQLVPVREVRLIETALYCATKYKSSRCLYYDEHAGFMSGYPMS